MNPRTGLISSRPRPGVLAVEMEAAALYAFATARDIPVTCSAHVTNTMGQQAGENFEKGEAEGTVTALRLIEAAVEAFRQPVLGAPGTSGTAALLRRC